jgi:cell wall-associated NlpC family hydrolase
MSSGALGTLLDDSSSAVTRLLTGAAGVILLAALLAVSVLSTAATVLSPAAGLVLVPAIGARAPLPFVEPAGPARADVVDVARRYLGVPYVFGGTNPAVGLDCSGLVQLAYRQVGVQLPRTAQQQYDATTRVAREDLQPGDLVFFARTYADARAWITHVGIYVGGGQQINAPTTGQVVAIQPVFSGFWGAHYTSGGRVRRG